MVKLIASDLDGTILQNGAQSVDESVIKTINKLSDCGVIFAPASGRQVESLKKLFEPLGDRLMYIGENGALVKYKGNVILKKTMDRQLAMDIIEDIMKMPNCEVLVSGETTAYIKPKTKEYLHRMTKVVKYNTKLVDSFDDIREDIIKVAVCDMSGIKNSQKHFMDKWSGKAAVTVSGELYMDFMDSEVNKGYAMKHIQELYGIDRAECVAFGDNYNDCEMLMSVDNSYAMSGAVNDVKKCARYETDNVEKVLLQYLKQLQ